MTQGPFDDDNTLRRGGNNMQFGEPKDKFSFRRAIRALVTGDWRNAELEQRGMMAASDVAGGYLVSDSAAGELIGMLVPQLIFARIPGIRRYNPAGTGGLPLPKKTSRSTAYWLSESQEISASNPEFGQIRLSPHKLGALIPVSNELLADSSGAGEQVIRDDLTEALSLAADAGYLRGQGAASEPLGIRNWQGITEIASGGAVSTDKITDCLIAVQAENANPTCWIANPRTKGTLLKLKDGNGRPILISDLTGSPVDRLYGLPVLYSSIVPAGLGAGGDETELYCIDGAQIALAIWQEITLAASDSASFWDEAKGKAVSAFASDQTLIRSIIRTDVAVRQEKGICVLTGIVV
jgi:HK97 family phage major capsid protein